MKPKTKFKQTEIGMIPEEWEVKELGEIANFQYGLGESAQLSGDYIYIRISDINCDGFLNKVGLAFLDKEKVKEEYILQKGDVLIARTGATYGKTYLFRENFKATFGGFLIRILFSNKLNNKFFFHFSRSKLYRNQANNLVGGGAQPQFNINVISKLKIPLPPLPEQRAIASILSSLDDKIELNQQMNKTLEAIGQAIFKHWFIDFEFPNEEGKPYKSSGGEMVYNEELGKEIPKGWRVEKILNEFDIVYGKNISVNEIQPIGPYPVFGANGIIGYLNSYEYEMPMVTISCRGAASGKVILIPPKSTVSHNSLVLFSKNKSLAPYFIYSLLKNIDMEQFVTGSAQPQLTVENLNSLSIIIPNNKELKNYNFIMSKIFELKFENKNNSKTLSQIRDLLLPKLMSGKIRVPVENENEIENNKQDKNSSNLENMN